MRIFLGLAVGMIGLAPPALGQEPGSERPVSAAASRLDRAVNGAVKQQKVLLRYRFEPGESSHWDVEHVQSTRTSIAGHSETASSRTQTRTRWTALSVDSLGRATLQQTIESIHLWRQIGEAEPISFDSRSGQDPPPEFADAARNIGRPLEALTLGADGEPAAAGEEDEGYDFGAQSFWIPLPAEPVAVGHRWYVARELLAKQEDASMKRIKMRTAYELVAVRDQRAEIRFDTEVLTPVESPKIRSQICQQMTRGQLVFDLAEGRIAEMTVHWNEKVLAFAGPDSLMHYLGQYTIRAAPADDAVQPASDSAAPPLVLRTREQPPIFRN